MESSPDTAAIPITAAAETAAITPTTTTTATATATITISTSLQAYATTNSLCLQKASNRDRIVWTYNAPLQPHQLAALQQQQQQQQYSNTNYGHHVGINNSHHNSYSSSISSSPQNSVGSPASPTSVSSSVMSSSGSKGALGIGSNFSHNNGHLQHQQQQQHQQQHYQQHVIVSNGGVTSSTPTGTIVTNNMGLLQCPNGNNSGGGSSSNVVTASGGGGGDHSVSEAISNISSPDYQDDDNLLSSRDLLGGMVLSDPSDSDSTILVSDAAVQRQQQRQQQKSSEHKVVIQVRGADSVTASANSNHNNNNNNNNNNGTTGKSLYSELKDSEDDLATLTEDVPLATTLGNAIASTNEVRDSSPPVSDDGSDVESLHSYHYSPKAVDMPSAIRLAKRLYSLDGFKKSDVSRHLSKNNDFSRAVADEYLKYFTFEQKTLDLSLREFLQQFSLSGETQERERVLVHFSKRYLDCNPGSFNSQDAVHTLTCAIMLLNTDLHGQNIGRKMTCSEFIENLAELNDGDNFPKEVLKYLYQAIKTQPLEWALDDDAVDLQKQLTDSKQSILTSGGLIGQNPFLDLPESSAAVEYKKGYVMHEHGFRKSQMSDNLHNAIRIHHALATKASDYTKKQHVFRLQTADQAEYLFQTSDSKELQSWVETINFVCAAYSAPPLEGGVGSQKRFQRPLLPSTHTKLLMKEQLESHEQQLDQLESSLMEHRKGPIPSKGLALQNYKEKENYLQYEQQQQQISQQQQQQQQSPTTQHQTTGNRYSYRAAIYRSDRTEQQQDLG
uniref:SEC7 domain-containing protein n=1 Tax=Glossina austeni TaxID=7395 RepID=A0A1A9VVW0_GLOAU